MTAVRTDCVSSQGVSLTQAKEKGQLIFLEGLKESLSVFLPQEENAGHQAMSFLRYSEAQSDAPHFCILLINKANFIFIIVLQT